MQMETTAAVSVSTPPAAPTLRHPTMWDSYPHHMAPPQHHLQLQHAGAPPQHYPMLVHAPAATHHGHGHHHHPAPLPAPHPHHQMHPSLHSPPPPPPSASSAKPFGIWLSVSCSPECPNHCIVQHPTHILHCLSESEAAAAYQATLAMQSHSRSAVRFSIPAAGGEQQMLVQQQQQQLQLQQLQQQQQAASSSHHDAVISHHHHPFVSVVAPSIQRPSSRGGGGGGSGSSPSDASPHAEVSKKRKRTEGEPAGKEKRRKSSAAVRAKPPKKSEKVSKPTYTTLDMKKTTHGHAKLRYIEDGSEIRVIKIVPLARLSYEDLATRWPSVGTKERDRADERILSMSSFRARKILAPYFDYTNFRVIGDDDVYVRCRLTNKTTGESFSVVWEVKHFTTTKQLPRLARRGSSIAIHSIVSRMRNVRELAACVPVFYKEAADLDLGAISAGLKLHVMLASRTQFGVLFPGDDQMATGTPSSSSSSLSSSSSSTGLADPGAEGAAAAVPAAAETGTQESKAAAAAADTAAGVPVTMLWILSHPERDYLRYYWKASDPTGKWQLDQVYLGCRRGGRVKDDYETNDGVEVVPSKYNITQHFERVRVEDNAQVNTRKKLRKEQQQDGTAGGANAAGGGGTEDDEEEEEDEHSD